MVEDSVDSAGFSSLLNEKPARMKLNSAAAADMHRSRAGI